MYILHTNRTCLDFYKLHVEKHVTKDDEVIYVKTPEVSFFQIKPKYE